MAAIGVILALLPITMFRAEVFGCNFFFRPQKTCRGGAGGVAKAPLLPYGANASHFHF